MRYVVVVRNERDLSRAHEFASKGPKDTLTCIILEGGEIRQTDDTLFIPLVLETRPALAGPSFAQKGTLFENTPNNLPPMLALLFSPPLRALRDTLQACDPDVIDLRPLGVWAGVVRLALFNYFRNAVFLTFGTRRRKHGMRDWRRYNPDALISVVLPVFNGSRYLATSITSCLNQSHSCFELIIVDDASTDNSLQIASEFAASDQRVRIVRNAQNMGLPKALNVGFREAKGEYLTWTSHDNAYEPEALRYMAGQLSSHSELAMVYCGMRVIDENDVISKIVLAKHPWYLREGNVVGACFLYRRSIIDCVGLYDPDFSYAEDYEYWVRVAKAVMVRNLYQPLYRYRVHKESLSKAFKDRWPVLIAKVHEKHFASGGGLYAWTDQGPETLAL